MDFTYCWLFKEKLLENTLKLVSLDCYGVLWLVSDTIENLKGHKITYMLVYIIL